MNLQRKEKNLTEKDPENVSGGIMNRKLAASVLTVLSVLTASSNLAKANGTTYLPTVTSQREVKNQNMNSKTTKAHAIEDINYALRVIKDIRASSVKKLPNEVINLAKIEIKTLKNKVNVVDEGKNYEHFETKHFDVIYPKDSKEQCEQVLKKLEESYDKVTNDLKVKVDKKTKIKLFKTKDDFHKSIGCYGTSLSNWVNGTGGDGFIKTHLELTPERIKQILVHEFTHIAVENINKGHIPFIFNDGIATYEANQTWLKENFEKHLNEYIESGKQLPTQPDWLIKYPQSPTGYELAYSFTEFIVKNYGYDKMIELLKTDYQNNKFDFESVNEIYSKWKTSVLNH